MKSDTMWHTNVILHKMRYHLTDKLLCAEGTRSWATTSKLDHGKIPWSTIISINHIHVCMGTCCPIWSITPLIPSWRGTGDTASPLMWLLPQQALLKFAWGGSPHENWMRAILLQSPRGHGHGSGNACCEGHIWMCACAKLCQKELPISWKSN